MQFPIKKRGGKKLLEERKKRVLQAIVEEYIKTAEPVSSGAIMNLEGLEYSSATIRNEMAELEKMGYIEKTLHHQEECHQQKDIDIMLMNY